LPPAGHVGSRTGGNAQLGSNERANLDVDVDVDVEDRSAGAFLPLGGVLVAVMPPWVS
jgi:hypothetical protein